MGCIARIAGSTIAILALAVTTAGAAPRQIQIYNDSDFAMVALQARPPMATTWPFDLLGKYSLGVGRSQTIALPAGDACVYDFLATFDDGHKLQKLAVNVCKTGTVNFSDS